MAPARHTSPLSMDGFSCHARPWATHEFRPHSAPIQSETTHHYFQLYQCASCANWGSNLHGSKHFSLANSAHSMRMCHSRVTSASCPPSLVQRRLPFAYGFVQSASGPIHKRPRRIETTPRRNMELQSSYAALHQKKHGSLSRNPFAAGPTEVA
eukprot:371240-Amphidinium_carterae.1